ncbi:cysteine hydrolase [Sansalvadorimonas sp. 2012CJ34-2]|uniref:Cysteine hydrolase n=1 Tax=Parendozoicomonas callyspongiae TaxID=2942213 RepID=A0ABT0PNB4_9GAMM|nr:cysteine hydrolase [Sansalvadorimonas sp. 2012CJ34-2]MCL6272227.1 cysteine hydrolase [Sansalvadorimonas sp. 2012CJ34-2]
MFGSIDSYTTEYPDVNSSQADAPDETVAITSPPLTGKPSSHVSEPRKHNRGDYHFNRDLAPEGCKSINPVCKNYVPDVEKEFYSQIDKALNSGLKFTLCLVDVYSIPKAKVINLIEFCKNREIDIINYDYEPIVADGRRTPDEILKVLPEGTPTIIKQTFSIFSAPETHEHLRGVSPDALIIAGEICNCCIAASILGLDQNSIYHDWYGDEFGATQYGYPVYTHKDLILDSGYPDKDLNKIQNKLFYNFQLLQ